MKTICVIQARLGSTRLPGKVLMDICGRPMIQHVIERARAIQGVDEVVATVPREDHSIHTLLYDLAVRHYWHQPPDVLSGYYWAARAEDADVIVRFTGDCPLLCPEVSKFVLDGFWESHGYDLYYNTATINGRWIGMDGFDTEVFTREALGRAHRECTGPDREHVTSYMRRTMKTLYAPGFSGFDRIKLSVDIQEDLDRVRRIMARIPAGDYSWTATQQAIKEVSV